MSTLAVDGCHVLFKKGNMYKVIKWGWLVRFWKKEEKIVCTRDGEEHYCLVVVGSCNLMNHEEGTPLTRKLEPACRYLLSIYDWWALKLVHCCTLDACSEMKERFVPMCRKNKPPSKGLLVSAIMTTTRFHLSHVDKKKMLVLSWRGPLWPFYAFDGMGEGYYPSAIQLRGPNKTEMQR